MHKDVGSSLSEAEYDGVGAHIFNSQATGDILYASSSSQLSRLAKGAANTVLVMGASIPAWSATLAGLTLTSAGPIALAAQAVGNDTPLHYLTGYSASGSFPLDLSAIYNASDADHYIILGATLSGGTRNAPTFTGGYGAMFIRQWSLALGTTHRLDIGTIPAGAAQSATTLLSILSTGSVTLGTTLTVSAQDIVTDTTTGTKIGTATAQKLGFYGATPVNRPDTVADATGCNGDADDKVNLIIDRLQELGLLA